MSRQLGHVYVPRTTSSLEDTQLYSIQDLIIPDNLLSRRVLLDQAERSHANLVPLRIGSLIQCLSVIFLDDVSFFTACLHQTHELPMSLHNL